MLVAGVAALMRSAMLPSLPAVPAGLATILAALGPAFTSLVSFETAFPWALALCLGCVAGWCALPPRLPSAAACPTSSKL